MLRALCLVALLAAAQATTLSCYSTTITVSAGICSSKSGTYSLCSASQALADATGAAAGAAVSLMTTATQTAAGTAACALAGGTGLNTDWWTSSDRCPSAPPCDSSTCGSTATSAPPAPGAPTAVCCAFYNSLFSSACTGTMTFTPTTNLTNLLGITTIAAANNQAAGGACADTNCITPASPNSASSVAYTLALAFLAPLVALFF